MKIKKISQIAGLLASVLNIKTNSDSDTYSCNYINEKFEKPKRTVLFNDSDNELKTIELSESAYNYSYLFVKAAENYNVMITIYDDEQVQLRGIGGWTGAENGGTNHFYGSLSNGGKTLNVTYFRSIVHTASGNHNAGADNDVKYVAGIR